jgi:hypothetical protein
MAILVPWRLRARMSKALQSNAFPNAYLRMDGIGVTRQVSWVTADEADGQNPTFRGWLAAREVPFVLATRKR